MPNMGRIQYQLQWAKGKILNIGCGDDPAGFGVRATHLDIDIWDHPNFIQGDCCHLPFGNKSFDTAVLGDVLEHCLNPDKAVSEAARVAYRVVMTIPEAIDLPSVGQYITLGVKARADAYRSQHHIYNTSDDEVILAHKLTSPKFIKGISESEMPHDGHINRFDETWIRRMIRSTGMKIMDFQKVAELNWMNWLITIEDYSSPSHSDT